MHFIPHGRPVRSWRRILRNRMPKIRPLPANELFKAIQFFLSRLPATAEQPFLQLLGRTSARREVIAEIQFHIPQKQQAIFPAKASDMLFKGSDHLLLPFHEKFAHTGVHSHRLHVTFRFGHLIHQHLPRKNRLQGQLSPILRWSNNLKSVRSGGGRVLFLCLFFGYYCCCL